MDEKIEDGRGRRIEHKAERPETDGSGKRNVRREKNPCLRSFTLCDLCDLE
jgi:hypothetical protein